MPKLSIQQIAIRPINAEAAIKLLSELGADKWVVDTVVASGEVFGSPGENVANLAFNYSLCPDKEFEVLDYITGPAWANAQSRFNTVCHLGTHCTEEELKEFRAFFSARGIGVAQEVHTSSHSNPEIAGKRWYHYVIFNTKPILGVDIKFIVREGAPHDGDRR